MSIKLPQNASRQLTEDFQALFDAWQAVADGRVADVTGLASGVVEAFQMGLMFEDVVARYIGR